MKLRFQTLREIGFDEIDTKFYGIVSILTFPVKSQTITKVPAQYSFNLAESDLRHNNYYFLSLFCTKKW